MLECSEIHHYFSKLKINYFKVTPSSWGFSIPTSKVLISVPVHNSNGFVLVVLVDKSIPYCIFMAINFVFTIANNE